MSRQLEQILEDQAIPKNGVLALVLFLFLSHKTLKINSIKNLSSKIFKEYKKDITFTSTVPVLLPVRSAHGSFFFIGFTIKLLHFFCLSSKHDEGLFQFKHNFNNG